MCKAESQEVGGGLWRKCTPGLVHPGGAKGRATAPTQTPAEPGVEGFGPGRHLHGASLRGWMGAASWFRAETVGARLGGRGVALRPLQTWNGEGASGEDVSRGHGESPPAGSPELSAGPWRQAASHRLAGEGICGRSDSGDMEDKTDGTHREGPPRDGDRQGHSSSSTWWRGRAWPQQGSREGRGLSGRGQQGPSSLSEALPPLLGQPGSRGGGISPRSPSTERGVTNEMEETRTAGGMTWPASHCPLLGRVVPSSADVSAGGGWWKGRGKGDI